MQRSLSRRRSWRASWRLPRPWQLGHNRAVPTRVRIRACRQLRVARVRGRPVGRGRQHDRDVRLRRAAGAASRGRGSRAKPARPHHRSERQQCGRKRGSVRRSRCSRHRPRIRGPARVATRIRFARRVAAPAGVGSSLALAAVGLARRRVCRDAVLTGRDCCVAFRCLRLEVLRR